MKILADTGILIYMHTDDARLKPKARALLLDQSHTIFYSVAALMEAEENYADNREAYPFSGERLRELCDRADLMCLPLMPDHIVALHRLKSGTPTNPYKRLMLAQAHAEGMQFMTNSVSDIPKGDRTVLTV